MVDIWLIKFNNPGIEEHAISLIKKYTTDYRLHIYDNYQKKVGVSTLWNRFIKESKGEYVCFINSDAFVSENWLEEMKRGFYSKDIAVVGPSGNVMPSVQGQIRCKQDADKMIGYYDQTIISGYCMLLKDVGVYFPEEIPFYHNEIAWQVKLQMAGYKPVWAKGAFVYHVGAATASKENIDFMRYAGEEQYKDWLKRFKEENEHLIKRR